MPGKGGMCQSSMSPQSTVIVFSSSSPYLRLYSASVILVNSCPPLDRVTMVSGGASSPSGAQLIHMAIISSLSPSAPSSLFSLCSGRMRTPRNKRNRLSLKEIRLPRVRVFGWSMRMAKRLNVDTWSVLIRATRIGRRAGPLSVLLPFRRPLQRPGTPLPPGFVAKAYSLKSWNSSRLGCPEKKMQELAKNK